MNEVTRIHLGRQPFVVSVDAKRELRKYLDDIAKQPSVQPEVVNEIELRMAELLAEHGISGDKVVLPEDIGFLKSQLGEAGDFKDDGAEDEPAAATSAKENGQSDGGEGAPEGGPGPKKLFRDTDDAWLAGVASGLAAYTGIDVLLVRVLFVLSIFLSGAGIIAYILIWLFAPEAKTPSDRLRMRGKAVTIDSLKGMVERADLAGASERAGQRFGRGLGKLVELFAKVVLMVVGSVFVAAGIVTMLWSMAAGAYLLIHGGQIGTAVAFPVGNREIWLTVLATITLVLLGFFLLMSGLAMTTRTWRLPTWGVVALVSIFMVSGGIAGALAADTVPRIRERCAQAYQYETGTVDYACAAAGQAGGR